MSNNTGGASHNTSFLYFLVSQFRDDGIIIVVVLYSYYHDCLKKLLEQKNENRLVSICFGLVID